ncbi:hypothetical protein ACF0H5_016903 [Mactra antiquata]
MFKTLLTLWLTLAVGSLAIPTRTSYTDILKEVLKVVEKELDFFTEDYSAINVDGLFGLRLGQGQLRETLKECGQHGCDQFVLRKVTELEERLDRAANAALPYVETEDPDYYERFLATIDQPYITTYEPSSFEGVKATVGNNANYGEDNGDACYARILGTYKENGRFLPKCNITSDCFDYMRQTGTSRYFITHQLLYFILLEHVGCKENVEQSLGTKIRDIQDTFCAGIYEESKQISKSGQVNDFLRDLFLEQTVLCGSLGYEDFMRSDWIKMVLEWPDKRLGCFRNQFMKQLADITAGKNENKNGNSIPSVKSGKMKADDIMRSAYEERSSLSTMRKLQREKQMKEGCLSHTSGLGFGVFCTYLRFLVRYIPMYMF